MDKEYYNLWCVKDGLRRIRVKSCEQQRTKRLGPITVWRDEYGVTYSEKYVRRWEELSPDQKKQAYRELYQARRNAVLFEMLKDKTLELEYHAYIAQIKAERDAAITKIDAGLDPGEPPHVWE